MKAAVITVNDLCALGEFTDPSSSVVASKLASAGIDVAVERAVKREFEAVARVLRDCSAGDFSVDVVITTGGTGLSRRDITPEATLSVIDRPIPGIAEEIRRCSTGGISNSILSRGVAGLKHKTLIVNLPGSPDAVTHGIDVVLPVLSQITDLLNG
ncbi:MAG: MogA/MoaB family molybdenum cofactor biosynthesis protein [Armatimonadota bacterium]